MPNSLDVCPLKKVCRSLFGATAITTQLTSFNVIAGLQSTCYYLVQTRANYFGRGPHQYFDRILGASPESFPSHFKKIVTSRAAVILANNYAYSSSISCLPMKGDTNAGGNVSKKAKETNASANMSVRQIKGM